jgi:hypothetical protein
LKLKWMQVGWMALALAGVRGAAEITPLPEKVPCAVADKQDFQIPDRVQLNGWLGTRITANEANRLAQIDTDRLLEGYRKRPGRQSWDGEHIGKWLHAATLAWVNTGDAALRAKLDTAAAELCKCQLADGYLGTYLDQNRWTAWDIWAHKYNLIGLITYMRFTGNTAPLATCQRMGDLLCKTFGDAPGQRDIIPSGEHMGMAPTSVLEPMVLLYRFTGEKRYLDFCNYILRAWEQPNGPHIVSRLLELKRVDKVGNAKAYEMLSCLNGALELYRTTGNAQLLTACQNAWQDIVDHRLYLTGAASYREHFHDDFDLPNVNSVGETCVTVTWLQFNAQLLRLTGEARYAEQLEHVTLNQLLGAQKPDGTAWGYYVQMEGKKPYSATLDGHCCLSSGPRGVALLPTCAVATDADGAVINLLDAGVAHLQLRDGTPLTLKIETLYPAEGLIRIAVEPAAPKACAVKLRIPAWAAEASLHASIPLEGSTRPGPDGYTTLRGTWTPGSRIELKLTLAPRLVVGDHLNQGKVAFCYGPLVLAADEALLAADGQSLNTIAVAKPDLAALAVTPEPAPADFKTWPGAQVYRINAVTRRGGQPISIRLVPFADAGMTGARYKVWLPLAGQPSANLLLDGTESRSRQGNQNGSINDDDPGSFVVTFDGKGAKEDWFAVTLPQPATAGRVIFTQGKIFHDGGWFDASAGKPRVQIQRTAGGVWETIGELAGYPATTATDSKKMKWGNNQFTLQLKTPVTFVALRVIGTPAGGDNPKQAFASCAELQAFAE